MKTWYCVTSTFDNRGRVTSNITASCQTETKPENTFSSTSMKDIYNDWFASYKEAKTFAMSAKEA